MLDNDIAKFPNVFYVRMVYDIHNTVNPQTRTPNSCSSAFCIFYNGGKYHHLLNLN